MRKIAFFTPGLDIGGIERVFITYALAFLKEGYDVSYVICKGDGAFISSLPPEIKIVSLGERKLRHSIIPLFRYLKKNPVDYFISGSIIANALSILLGKLAGTKSKIIISHHNYFNIEQQHLLSSLIIGLLYNKAHRIFSVSEGITEMLLKRQVKRSKIVTIYNPIDIDTLRLAAEVNLDLNLPEKYLLFLGRLGEVKNLIFLLNAFHVVQQKDPSLNLVIIGDGPMKDILVQKAEDLGLKNKIHFTGSLSNPFPVLKNASAVVLTSFSEALPTVILESFALGTTMISTPTNGAMDLLEKGKFGYLSTSFEDVNEFATLLEKGLKLPFPKDLLKSKAQQYDISQKVKEFKVLLSE